MPAFDDTRASIFLKQFGKTGLGGLLSGSFRVLAPPAVRLLGAGVQFLSTVIIARQLGDQGSAAFFFWSALLTSLAPVATYGLEYVVLKSVPRLDMHGEQQKVVSYLQSVRTFSMILSLAIGLGLFAYALVRNHAEGADFRGWELLLPLGLCALAITNINGEALKGLSRPIAGVFFGHFVPVSIFCMLILLNLGRLSSPGLVVIYVSAYLLGLIVVRAGPSRAMKAGPFSLPRKESVKVLAKEGFPVFCTNTLGAIAYVLPLTILDFLRPAVEVSYVTTSFRISILLSILAAAIHGVFAPDLSRAAAIPGNGKGVFRVYAKTTGITLAVLAIPFAVGILFPGWVMSIFGEEFRAAAWTLRILLISGVLSLGVGPMMQLLLMTGNTGYLAKLGVIKLILVTILSFLLIPRFGGVGMVLAMGFAFLLEEVIGILYVVLQYRRPKQATEVET